MSGTGTYPHAPTRAPHISFGVSAALAIIGCRSPSWGRPCHPTVIHSSSRSCNCGTVQHASSSTPCPRRVVFDPVYPATCWQNSVLIAPNVRSTTPFAAGLRGGAGCTLTPNVSHAARNASDTNTLPRSTTIVSGTITGRAAAPSNRPSTVASRSYGTLARDSSNASGQCGRIGCGTTISASNKAASTALVPSGRNTAATTLRVATSTAIVNSGRPNRPSSKTAITSKRVLSTWTCSPGRDAPTGANGGVVALAVRAGRPGNSAGSAKAFTNR
ncbi:hypothetical protein [Embleya sp. NBC_00896]|uniref:hypothetical protein n=1 Tax=Embleya sp. NBC_00896 TaxID=2975961 RepID=UPI002F91A775